MEGEVSLPSNYVTIQQLKERWLQQNHQNPAKSNPHHHKQLNLNQNDEAALKRVPRRRPDDRHPVIKPEIVADDSDSGFKTQIDVVDNHRPKGDKEKKEHFNSKLPNKKNGSRRRKPRFVTDPNPNGDGTPLLEPETVMNKIQTKQLDVRRSRNQNGVWEPKDKMPQTDARDRGRRGGGVDDVAIAAAMTVTNVNDGRNRRRGSERPQVKPKPKSWKPPFGLKKGQPSFIWVKKGESTAN